MRFLTSLFAVGAVFGLTIRAAQSAEPPSTSSNAGSRLVGSNYVAVIGADGCLTSVRVGGTEFLKSEANFPRGLYLYQDGLLKLARVVADGTNVLLAAGEKAAIRYEARPDGIACTLSNFTQKPVLLVGVFDTNVAVVMDAKNRGVKTPVNRSWETTTWFRAGASLRLKGGSRIWGPWSGNHQVWQADVPPGGTRQVFLEAAPATPAEMAQADRIAKAPPPAPPTDPSGPMWDMTRLSLPPKTHPATGITNEAGVTALFFDGPMYQGQPTRVFAWIGLPKVEDGRKFPGMVLVHGGGGTAFAEWVRLWTSRGYAAIAMDTCGCVPVGKYSNWRRHDHGGPPGWGGFDQIDDSREDQWTHHAVSAAILAHSLLRAQPEVDAERIGLTGISWGGYLTCIIAGVDHRFKLAVPVYGCGFYLDTVFGGNLRKLSPEQRDRWMRWWEPSLYLRRAPMPFLWVTGSNDFAYTMDALQSSYRLPPGSRALAIRLRMPHGHGAAGEKPKEIHAFADSILQRGESLPIITAQGRQGRQVHAAFKSARPVVKAELNITRDQGRWQDRKWEAMLAQIGAEGKVTATLPDGVTVYYLNLFDDRDCVVSTEHEEIKP